jgi:hypothetical protein
VNAERHESYKQVKAEVEAFGTAKMPVKEQAQVIEWAEDLLLSGPDLDIAAQSRRDADAFIDDRLANRPNWQSESTVAAAQRLRDHLDGCCPDLVAAAV